MTRPFHIALHVRPAGIETASITLDGRSIPALVVTPAQAEHSFAVSFEDYYATLERLPRLFIEPDGSFVWVVHDGIETVAAPERQQVDGLLFDRNGRLLYVELKGTCDSPAFDELLRGLGWPKTPVMVQLLREAIFLDEATFRSEFLEPATKVAG